MREVTNGLKRLGKIRTSETYTSTLNSFMRFMEGRDIPPCDMDSDLMIAYEAWLKSGGVSMNTISFYMRNLRAVYNRAVEKELVIQRFPFRHVYTGVERTTKRAVPLRAIKQLMTLDLSLHPAKRFARDMLLLSFYTRGMSMIDMVFLKKKDLNNGILSYRRKKTGQQLFVKWEPCMQEIVDRYNIPGSPYLLPIIARPGMDERKQYINASRGHILFMLRNYQHNIKQSLISEWEKHNSIMVQMPTGTGKTHLLASLVNEELKTKNEESCVWIVAHRRELVEQIEATVARYGISKEDGRVKVMSIQWLSRHWDDVREEQPSLIVIDEVHHALAETYKELWLRYPEAKKLGMTATPCRLNRKGFTDLFETLITSDGIADFIRQGWLSPFDYVSIRPNSEDQRLIDGLEKRGFYQQSCTGTSHRILRFPLSVAKLSYAALLLPPLGYL